MAMPRKPKAAKVPVVYDIIERGHVVYVGFTLNFDNRKKQHAREGRLHHGSEMRVHKTYATSEDAEKAEAERIADLDPFLNTVRCAPRVDLTPDFGARGLWNSYAHETDADALDIVNGYLAAYGIPAFDDVAACVDAFGARQPNRSAGIHLYLAEHRPSRSSGGSDQ